MFLILIIAGIIVFIIMINSSEDDKKNDDNNDDKEEIKNQEISIAIEVFKFRKNQRKKPHEIPNINEEVFFLSEEFKHDDNDFEMIFNGKTQNFPNIKSIFITFSVLNLSKSIFFNFQQS